MSLVEAQRNYAAFGATERRVLPYVRRPHTDDPKDPDWRPIDPEADDIEEPTPGGDYGATYPKDRNTLYYWKPAYWRRGAGRR